jgi:NadR type nicotinamide-nucleotide adenylyltransferase
LKRIVVTGSESTGKTELARRLADHFGAELVPEFVREFAASKGAPISFSDHGPIARGQMALEDEHIARATRADSMVIQDTDLLSTVVYCDHYFGACPRWIAELARERRPDLYLLAEIDVPWVADGIRDRGHLRDEMQSLFRNAVRKSGSPWVAIQGTWDQRWDLAVAAVDRLRAEQAT